MKNNHRHIDDNSKVTLTFEQLKKLVKESIDSMNNKHNIKESVEWNSWVVRDTGEKKHSVVAHCPLCGKEDYYEIDDELAKAWKTGGDLSKYSPSLLATLDCGICEDCYEEADLGDNWEDAYKLK